MRPNSAASTVRSSSIPTVVLPSSDWSCLQEVDAMLSREEAEKQLKNFHVKNWEKDRLTALGALPKGLCEAGRFLLGRDAAGKPFRGWEKRNQVEERVKKELSGLPAGDRNRLFA